MKRVNGKTAVVTGAASGIGEVIARLFAQEGARVIAIDIDQKGQDISSMLEQQGYWVKFKHCNVTKHEQIQEAMGYAFTETGSLDVLINCAGIVDQFDIVETKEEDWDRIIAVNLKGVFLSMKYAIPRMLDNGGGSIINISSLSAIMHRSVGVGDAYSASKGGVISLTNSVAMKYARKGIRVNSILPGPIITPMNIKSFEEWEPRVPLRRLGVPSDIAQAALFLASDESSFITGVALPVDGGVHAAAAPSRRKTPVVS